MKPVYPNYNKARLPPSIAENNPRRKVAEMRNLREDLEGEIEEIEQDINAISY